MIRIHVPATSANVGPGFDTVGLALSLGNTVEMEQADRCLIESADHKPIVLQEKNLVYQSARLLYQECGRQFTGLRLVQTSPIPMASGMGSSSACIVAGLLGANALLGNPFSRQELLTLAARQEGHPDNVAPALLGGLVASCIQDGQVYSVKKEISPTLEFGVFVPDYELHTEQARAVLPQQAGYQDIIYNLSRAPLLQAALCEGRHDLLPVVTGDRLHQRYRLPMIPGGQQIFELALQAGAAAVCISGAGPSILAILPEDSRPDGFWNTAERALELASERSEPAGGFQLMRLRADNLGARLI